MAGILIIDDDPGICEVLSHIVSDLGHCSETANTLAGGLAKVRKDRFDIVILDLEFPEGNGLDILPGILSSASEPEVIIFTGAGTAKAAEAAFKHGAWDFVRKPFVRHEVALSISRALQYRQEKKSSPSVRPFKRTGIIGQSNDINSCLHQVAKAAATEASVLISGESGAGKELFARAIHENSFRAKSNYVVVDCSALPETLIEDTLFGHEKGSFTGADKSREGLIKQADGGTLFLDEIGELPLSLQKSLLRVLQEKKFRPVGGKDEVSSDFRLVVATNRDLDKMESEGLFRRDLLYRIKSFEILVPPLRKRKEDIKLLLFHYLEQFSRETGGDIRGVSPEFLEALQSHSWPGNVRELINTIQGALITAGGDPILYPIHLPVSLRKKSVENALVETAGQVQTGPESLSSAPNLPTMKEYRTRFERDYLKKLLLESGEDRQKASLISGLSQSRLYSLLKQHGLPSFGSAGKN